MTAVFTLIQVLFAIVFEALTRFVKTVLLAASLIISLFFGAIILIIWLFQR